MSVIFPVFVRSSVNKVVYRGEDIDNFPINLGLVKMIKRKKYASYVDNVGLPAIEFHFAGEETEYWVYEKLADREDDFTRIEENMSQFVPELKEFVTGLRAQAKNLDEIGDGESVRASAGYYGKANGFRQIAKQLEQKFIKVEE